MGSPQHPTRQEMAANHPTNELMKKETRARNEGLGGMDGAIVSKTQRMDET